VIRKEPMNKKKDNNAKHTAAGIPTWSPTVVLICRSTAYVWQSGRDAQFSADCGRMCLIRQSQHLESTLCTAFPLGSALLYAIITRMTPLDIDTQAFDPFKIACILFCRIVLSRYTSISVAC
jgi:hypothetical protein